jgi:hypothetical protein
MPEHGGDRPLAIQSQWVTNHAIDWRDKLIKPKKKISYRALFVSALILWLSMSAAMVLLALFPLFLFGNKPALVMVWLNIPGILAAAPLSTAPTCIFILPVIARHSYRFGLWNRLILPLSGIVCGVSTSKTVLEYFGISGLYNGPLLLGGAIVGFASGSLFVQLIAQIGPDICWRNVSSLQGVLRNNSTVSET